MRKPLAILCLLLVLCSASLWSVAEETLPYQQMAWPQDMEAKLYPVETDFGYRIVGRGSAKLFNSPNSETFRCYLRPGIAVPLAQPAETDRTYYMVQLPQGETGYILKKAMREPEPEEFPAYALDTSCAGRGYIHVAARGTEPIFVAISMDERSHHVRIPPDGNWHPILLTLGPGEYSVRIYQAGLLDRFVADCLEISLGQMEPPDQWTLALMSSAHCDMVKNAELVAFAQELCEGAEDDWERFTRIRAALYQNAKYDNDYARSIQYTKIPDPQVFLERGGKGICGDYAAFITIACRAVGIPCKSISGINPNTGGSHGWNEVWLDGEWLLVDVVTEKSNKEKTYEVKRMSGSGYRLVPGHWAGFE